MNRASLRVNHDMQLVCVVITVALNYEWNWRPHIGEVVNSEKIDTKEELEDEILESGRDYSLRHILADKKFFELVKTVKEFDIGFKQFSYSVKWDYLFDQPAL